MARTAVVAGTASATANAVSRHQANKWQGQADEQAAQQSEAQQEQQAMAYQAAQQVAAEQQAAAPYAQPAPAAPSGGDLIGQLQQLGELHTAGVLTDAEFAQAKAKLLG
jgi:hypothetical protein